MEKITESKIHIHPVLPLKPQIVKDNVRGPLQQAMLPTLEIIVLKFEGTISIDESHLVPKYLVPECGRNAEMLKDLQ